MKGSIHYILDWIKAKGFESGSWFDIDQRKSERGPKLDWGAWARRSNEFWRTCQCRIPQNFTRSIQKYLLKSLSGRSDTREGRIQWRALFAPLFCTVFARLKKQIKGTLTDFRRKNDENFGLCLFYFCHFFKKDRSIY